MNKQENNSKSIEYDHNLLNDYISWKDKLHNEIRGGKLMFDVPKHYKWMGERELFIYYMDIGRFIS